MAKPFVVKEIYRLGQEEGLNDTEIAVTLGYSRATINRVRKEYSIPIANLKRRKDKTYTCSGCGSVVAIRRYERRKLKCEDCRDK